MNSIFLTHNQSDKEEYTKLNEAVTKSITSAFIDEKAYSGPTPEELKKIIQQDSILPEKGLGWEKVFKITEEKILPNLARKIKSSPPFFALCFVGIYSQDLKEG